MWAAFIEFVTSAPFTAALHTFVVAVVAALVSQHPNVSGVLGAILNLFKGKTPPAALLLVATLVLWSGAARASEKECCTPKSDNALAKQGAHAPEIAFRNDGGKVRLAWVIANEETYEGGKRKPSLYPTGLYVDLLFGKEKPELSIDGKKVDDAELQMWASRTVDARVRLTDKGFEFFGGRPAYGCVCGDSCACPADKCPSKCPVQVQTLWQSGPGVLGTQPQTFGPIRIPDPFAQPSCCSGGSCQLRPAAPVYYYPPAPQFYSFPPSCPNGKCQLNGR